MTTTDGRRPRALEARRQEGEQILPVVLSERGVAVPDDLTDLQTELWEAIVPHAEAVLQQSDQMTFRGLITALSRAIEADRIVNEEGLEVSRDVINTRSGVVQSVTVPNPMNKVSQDSWKLFNNFADRLGLSPTARAKLGLAGVQAVTAAQRLEKELGESPWDRVPDIEGEVTNG